MQLTGEQLVKAYRSMCTIREFGERMHKEFTTGQILGFVDRYASTHRGHGRSIEEGARS
jgi:pyruvate dehydrogenase E1 component alpha subunit